MGVIAVEGPDGSGKSTLITRARNLGRHFIEIRRCGPPSSGDQLTDTIRLLRDATVRDHITILADRHPLISEAVYGPLLRGNDSRYSYYQREEILDDLRGLDRIVYCRPPTSVIVANVAASKVVQLKGVEEKVVALVSLYDSLMKYLEEEHRIPVTRWDYTNPEAERLGLAELALFGDFK